MFTLSFAHLSALFSIHNNNVYCSLSYTHMHPHIVTFGRKLSYIRVLALSLNLILLLLERNFYSCSKVYPNLEFSWRMCFEVNQVHSEQDNDFILIARDTKAAFPISYNSTANTVRLWDVGQCWLDLFLKTHSVFLPLSVPSSIIRTTAHNVCFTFSHPLPSWLTILSWVLWERGRPFGKISLRRGDADREQRWWEGGTMSRRKQGESFMVSTKDKGSGIYFKSVNTGVRLWLVISCQWILLSHNVSVSFNGSHLAVTVRWPPKTVTTSLWSEEEAIHHVDVDLHLYLCVHLIS